MRKGEFGERLEFVLRWSSDQRRDEAPQECPMGRPEMVAWREKDRSTQKPETMRPADPAGPVAKKGVVLRKAYSKRGTNKKGHVKASSGITSAK